jgi:light-regulated signal transduction histidine kinase (bacteriophytochrome)
LGYFLSPHNSEGHSFAMANRIFAFIAIWVVALLLDNIKVKANRLQSMNRYLDREVEKRTRQLEARNRELEQFVYIASHDLQEPLRTVNSLTEHLASNYTGNFDENGQKSMRYITQSAARMSNLIKALLDYSRIGKNLEMSPVNSRAVLDDVRADLAAEIEEARADIRVGALPTVTANRTELRLLFQNLVNNAIKFRRPDADPVINIGSRHHDGEWEFHVSDNGMGISANHHEKIFAIFQRLNNRSEYPGTGIGLAHCKKIVEMHGGRIWVSSEPGRGSTFYFTIPN